MQFCPLHFDLHRLQKHENYFRIVLMIRGTYVPDTFMKNAL